MRSARLAVLALAVLSIPSVMLAQKRATAVATGPAPTISVAVDATDAPRHIFHSKVTIPATPGMLTVYYPKWIPGEHGPTGPVVDQMGIFFRANGADLKWRRDPLDMYTYQVSVPAGVTSVEASMDYVSLSELGGFSSGSSATDQMAVLSWNWLTVYPKGWGSDQIQVKPSVKVPAGWKYVSALTTTGETSGVVEFAPVSLTMVVDSPVQMGAHLRRVPLLQGKTPAHELDLVSDSEAAIAIKPEQQQGFDNLVAESGALFGARHYDHYNFLLSLSDHVAHFGLEHHQSDDSRLGEKYLTDPSDWLAGASLLPHEFVHSWNGKYRRPYDLATPEYQTPMQSELLWVYEGLTEYFGYLLTARTGLWTPEQWRDQMGILAMTFSHRPGRNWRSLEDTAISAQILYGAGKGYDNWRRNVDYYDEGALIWMEADVIIRQKTSGKKSLDDFAQLFFGPPSSGPVVKTYNYDEVVNTLNQVAQYDWRKFFSERVLNVAPQAPLAGIEQGGWKIVYDDQPSAFMRISEEKSLNTMASIGLLIDEKGKVTDSIVDGPAYKAGIAPGMKIVAVNGREFDKDRLRTAMIEARDSKDPIQLIVKNDGFYKMIALDYHDGPRYPHLVRDISKPDLLSEIVKPKVTTPPQPAPQIQQ